MTWTSHRSWLEERAFQEDRREARARAAMVRLVVAQQWAVAMVAAAVQQRQWAHHDILAANVVFDELGELPCADDVVAEALGEK